MKILRIIGRIVLVFIALILSAYLILYLWSLTRPEIEPVALVTSP